MLTPEDRAVLAFVVLDPDEWLNHAITKFGEEKAAEHLRAKVQRWTMAYEAAKTSKEPLTRIERDACGKQ